MHVSCLFVSCHGFTLTHHVVYHKLMHVKMKILLPALLEISVMIHSAVKIHQPGVMLKNWERTSGGSSVMQRWERTVTCNCTVYTLKKLCVTWGSSTHTQNNESEPICATLVRTQTFVRLLCNNLPVVVGALIRWPLWNSHAIRATLKLEAADGAYLLTSDGCKES